MPSTGSNVDGSRIIPPNTTLPPINPLGTSDIRTGPDGRPFPPLDCTRPWATLSADEQGLFARMAEVYSRVPQPRRPAHRPAARRPRGGGRAGQYPRDR